MSNEEEDLLAGYEEESEGHIKALEEQLLAMEAESILDDGINVAFRAIHTIKGGSGFFGLKKIGSIAHVMEDVLGKMRSGTLNASPGICDALLSGFDVLSNMFDDLSSSNDTDISESHDKICSFLQDEQIKDEDSGIVNPIICPFKGIDFSGIPIYYLKINLSETESAQTVIEELGGVGSVLETIPTERSTDLKEIEILFSSVLDESMIESLDINYEVLTKIEENINKETNTDITPPSSSQIIKKTPVSDKNKKSTKPTAIRVDFDQLTNLINLAGELILSRNQFINNLTGSLSDEFRTMSLQISDLQEGLMRTRMQSFSTVTDTFPRLVRNIAKEINKKVELVINNSEIELDRNILEGISGPFTHILRNSLDHGIEDPEGRVLAGKGKKGCITISAFQKSGYVNIDVSDDGKGIDPEKIKNIAVNKGILSQEDADGLSDQRALALLYAPGFSTAEKVTSISGRGVGMDVVKTDIEKLGGTVELNSKLGKGTTLSIQLPLSVAIIQSLIVTASGECYAVPRNSIMEVIVLQTESEINNLEKLSNGTEVFRYRSSLLPIVNMADVLCENKTYGKEEEKDLRVNISDRRQDDELDESENRKQDRRELAQITILVMRAGNDKYGIIVDSVSHQEETVVKTMNESIASITHFMGITILSSGRVCFILDTQGFCKSAAINFGEIQFGKDDIDTQKTKKIENQENYLIFNGENNERFAILAGLIKKTAVVSKEDIMKIKDENFVSLDDQNYQLIFLQDALKATEINLHDEIFLIIPKSSSVPFAIVCTKIQGIQSISSQLEYVGTPEKCKIGTVVYDKVLVSIIDLYSLESHFFQGATKKLKKLSTAKRVLLVEDALIFRKILNALLVDIGAIVVMAENGQEALDCMENQSFDLVISDIEMPIMDGFELATNIREQDTYHDLKLIALTSLVSKDDQVKGMRAGFDDYLLKTDREVFLASISKYLNI